MAAPKLYLYAAGMTYAYGFLHAVALLLAEIFGFPSVAAAIAGSALAGPLSTGLYIMEVIVAACFGWVSWFERPRKVLLRHHLAFLSTAGAFSLLWLLEPGLVSEWFSEWRALRLWMLSALLTNANEALMVLQNFIEETKPRKIFQLSLALGVMVQAVLIGFPCGFIILTGLAAPELSRRLSGGPLAMPSDLHTVGGFDPAAQANAASVATMAALVLGLVAQLGAQLAVQLFDSMKVAKRIHDMVNEYALDGRTLSSSNSRLLHIDACHREFPAPSGRPGLVEVRRC